MPKTDPFGKVGWNDPSQLVVGSYFRDRCFTYGMANDKLNTADPRPRNTKSDVKSGRVHAEKRVRRRLHQTPVALRQTNAADQRLKAWIITNTIETRVDFQIDEKLALIQCSGQPFEAAVAIAECEIN